MNASDAAVERTALRIAAANYLRAPVMHPGKYYAVPEELDNVRYWFVLADRMAELAAALRDTERAGTNRARVAAVRAALELVGAIAVKAQWWTPEAPRAFRVLGLKATWETRYASRALALAARAEVIAKAGLPAERDPGQDDNGVDPRMTMVWTSG